MSTMSNPDPSVVKPGFQDESSSRVEPWFAGPEKNSSISSFDWRKPGDKLHMNGAYDSSDLLSSLLERPSELNGFSSSLPALLHEKLNLSSRTDQSDDIRTNQEAVEEPLDENIVTRAIGDILPNDDELLAGITADFMNSAVEDNDDDLFSSGGGLEMDGETQEGFSMYMSRLDGFYGLTNTHGPPSNGPGSVIGEHPYGEHPSRTLFVRNINSNVEDSELQILFEQYGDIRTLYTACKHRGFVMISYYDIRAARSAMRALQNKPLRRRKLDIHFSIPKDNPSDKDVNQGTLVVFNLDASVSNDDLRQIFGQYGEVKEIRETPHKRHHKFIEFYDVRAAEAALRALNRSDIAGKRIKLEPSRPGGARRSLMQQLGQDHDQEDVRLYRQQSSPPVPNSPPGHFSSWGHFGSPLESGPVRFSHLPPGSSTPIMNKNHLPSLPNPRVGTIGSHLGRNNQVDPGLASLQSDLGVKGILPHHAHSFPEYSDGVTPFHNPSQPITAAFAASTSLRGAPNGPSENECSTRLPRTSNNLSLFEHAPGGPGISSNQGAISGSAGSSSLSGPQFLWGNSSSFQKSSSPVVWSNTSSMMTNFSGQSQPFDYSSRIHHPHYVGNNGFHLQRHHVGSAPSGDPSYLEKQFAYTRESHDVPYYVPGSVSSMNVSGMMSLGGSHHTNGFLDNGTPNMGPMSPHHHRTPMFPPSGMILSSHFDMIGGDRGRFRRMDNGVSQADNKKQYQLDIDRILRGDDNRTTLMIKNIPNKYTSKMLLSTIDENHKGMYDFLYLPIDFKNKCNVGYAFINMTSPEHIIPIYQSFNGKKWEKFNSEKVVSLAYARIQGKAALVAHFQNSSLMNEDKRCRPILLNSDGPETSEQEAMYEAISLPPLAPSNTSSESMSKADSQDGAGSSSTMSSDSP